MKNRMKYRVDIDFVGRGNAAKAYGGFLNAWSFRDIAPKIWFEEFRQSALSAIGQRFLPVYRMADGEYRFLMGREYNFSRKPLIKEILAVTAEKIRIKNPDKWKTSWGETYRPEDTRKLRKSLLADISFIAERGYLACYLNDNGLNAFTEYNQRLLELFRNKDIKFDETNYIPFHFCPSLLVGNGWRDFFLDRRILVVTGLNSIKEQAIRANINEMGARSVEFLPISSSSAMYDNIDLLKVKVKPDICLVAAGIGSANILKQLQPFNTLSLDIGGLMNCYVDRNASQHGGVISLPDFLNG